MTPRFDPVDVAFVGLAVALWLALGVVAVLHLVDWWRAMRAGRCYWHGPHAGELCPRCNARR